MSPESATSVLGSGLSSCNARGELARGGGCPCGAARWSRGVEVEGICSFAVGLELAKPQRRLIHGWAIKDWGRGRSSA